MSSNMHLMVVLIKPGANPEFIGTFPLRSDHATTYWAKTLEEKIFKITIYE